MAKESRQVFPKHVKKSVSLALIRGEKTAEQIEKELKMRPKWGRYQVQKWAQKFKQEFPEIISGGSAERSLNKANELFALQAKLGQLIMENEKLRIQLNELLNQPGKRRSRPMTL